MTEQIKQIAERIKALREISEQTTEAVSKMLTISTEEYVGYESGEKDIPMSFLYSFANAFHVDLTAILTGGSAKLHHFSVVRKGKGTVVERRKQYKYESLAHNFHGAKMEPFVVTVEPKDNEGIHLSTHEGQELDYILEGTLKISIDGHEVILEEGDSVYFDASLPHGMEAMNQTYAKFIAVIL